MLSPRYHSSRLPVFQIAKGGESQTQRVFYDSLLRSRNHRDTAWSPIVEIQASSGWPTGWPNLSNARNEGPVLDQELYLGEGG